MKFTTKQRNAWPKNSTTVLISQVSTAVLIVHAKNCAGRCANFVCVCPSPQISTAVLITGKHRANFVCVHKSKN